MKWRSPFSARTLREDGVAGLVLGVQSVPDGLATGLLAGLTPTAVMVGFINAVGVSIVLGQLANLTGYDADGANRLVRAVNTILNPDQIDIATLVVGVATIALIVLLERTRLGAIGLVVAVMATSAAAQVVGWSDVATLSDLGVDPDTLPRPELPLLSSVPALILPAVSLAFVGLVQGAGISANFTNPDGSYPDASRDFVGQGAANVASGLLQGMPVGGSVSASSLNKEAGARSRQSLLFAALVMVVVIVAFGDAVAYVAMPALAGLLMLIGYRTVKPADLQSVWKTGVVQKAVVSVTFLLTMVVPLQFAVLVGMGLSVVLHVVRQSNQVKVRRRVFDSDGHPVEVDPPDELPASEVVILQPYGSLFFAAAPAFEATLPAVGNASTGSVVILRLRGRSDLGTTFVDVLYRYAVSLEAVGSRLVIVSANERIIEQLVATGVTGVIGTDSVNRGDERVGATVRRAHADAVAWVDARS